MSQGHAYVIEVFANGTVAGGGGSMATVLTGLITP
jgi:hypothetical protein